MNSIITEDGSSGGNKKLYRYLKSQRQDSQGVSSLREGNKLLADAASKARALNEQFCSVFTKDTPETAEAQLDGPDYPTIETLHITVKGVEKLLAGLNPSKAPGPDQIPARILKTLSRSLAPSLTEIFRQSVSTGELPSDWTMAWITPIFKKGSRSDPSNYIQITCL